MSDRTTKKPLKHLRTPVLNRGLRESFRASRDLEPVELGDFQRILREAVKHSSRNCAGYDRVVRESSDKGSTVPLSEIGVVISTLTDTSLTTEQVSDVETALDATRQKIQDLDLLKDDQEE